MLVKLLRELVRRYFAERVYDLAAQLAYYILLSFFPFLLLTFTLLSYLPYQSENVLVLIRPYAPKEAFDLIQNNLRLLLDEKHSGILSFSIITTIYLASLAFHSMIRILNHTYQVQHHRSLLKSIFLGFFLMFALLLGLVLSLVLLVFGEHLSLFLFEILQLAKDVGELWDFFRWLLSSLFLLLVFICLYMYVPNTRITFREALPGALFSTLGWQISSYAFFYYVSLTDFSLIYGNVGSMIALVGWFYLTAMILIIGGQINAIVRELKGKS